MRTIRRSETALPGVCIVEHETMPQADERGWFMEIEKASELARLGIPNPVFPQTNASYSHRLVLRGLHWQEPLQAKLVQVMHGEILDVVVDIRPASPTFGSTIQLQLIASRPEMLYVPRGFAHGFVVLSHGGALVQYACDAEYAADGQRGIRWDDPALHINWTTTAPMLSAKDAALPFLHDIPREALPRYEP